MRSAWAVPILTYHAIEPGPPPLFTPPPVFESHLDALLRAGFRTWTLAGLVESLRGGLAPAERSIVLTFDDGYASIASEAWPRLEARGFSATVFLVTDRCGRDNRWKTQNPNVPSRPLLDWDEIARLAGRGAELGAHTRTHPPLTEVAPDAVEEEVAGSLSEIERRTGRRPRVFSYPYGASNGAVEAIVRRHFDGAVSTELALARPKSDPFRVPRVDSYYLSPRAIARLADPIFRGSLAVRRWLRASKRRFREDWSGSPRAAERSDGTV